MASRREGTCEREVNRLGQHLDRIRVMVGLERGEVDGGLAADEDATDKACPIPGDPVTLGIRADDEMRVPDLRKDGRYVVTHGMALEWEISECQFRQLVPTESIRSGRQRRWCLAFSAFLLHVAQGFPVGSGR